MTTVALGWIGSALVVTSLMQTDVRRLRQIGLASAVVLTAFNLLLAIPSMIALNTVLGVVNGYRLLEGRQSPRKVSMRSRNSGHAGSAALSR